VVRWENVLTCVGDVGAAQLVVDNKAKVTQKQVETFLHLCWVRYVKAKMEPGGGC
jgi:DNA-directed RNA polymerase III subunit RPC1